MKVACKPQKAQKIKPVLGCGGGFTRKLKPTLWLLYYLHDKVRTIRSVSVDSRHPSPSNHFYWYDEKMQKMITPQSYCINMHYHVFVGVNMYFSALLCIRVYSCVIVGSNL